MNKKVIDTNIFLRYLIQDNPQQHQKAKNYLDDIEQGKLTGLVSILVVDELIWALERYYRIKRPEFMPQILKIFNLKHINFLETKKDLILNCLEKIKDNKIDFTDVYLSQIATQKNILSFDKDFVKLYKK